MNPVQNWFVARNGQAEGPFTQQEILSQMSQGSLVGTHLLFCEGAAEWKPLFDWTEFSSAAMVQEKTSFTGLFRIPEAGQVSEGQWICLVRVEDGDVLHFRREGPFSREELLARLKDGKVLETDHVWTLGYPQWVMIGKCRELFSIPMHQPYANMIEQESARGDVSLEVEEFQTQSSGHSFDEPLEPFQIEMDLESVPPLETRPELVVGGWGDSENRRLDPWALQKWALLGVCGGLVAVVALASRFWWRGSLNPQVERPVVQFQMPPVQVESRVVNSKQGVNEAALAESAVSEPQRVEAAGTTLAPEKITRENANESPQKKLVVAPESSKSPEPSQLQDVDLSGTIWDLAINQEKGSRVHLLIRGRSGAILEFPALTIKKDVVVLEGGIVRIVPKDERLAHGIYGVEVWLEGRKLVGTEYRFYPNEDKFFLERKKYQKKIARDQQVERKKILGVLKRYSEFVGENRLALGQKKRGAKTTQKLETELEKLAVSEYKRAKSQRTYLVYSGEWYELAEFHDAMKTFLRGDARYPASQQTVGAMKNRIKSLEMRVSRSVFE